MNEYKGKKILFLGTNAGTIDLVKHAKERGAWIAVADYLPIEMSEAKKLADDAVQISTADHDLLVEYCKDNSIDTVYAGISEFNLMRAMELAETLGLPFYCTKKQWDLIAKKDSFRELCEEAKVPSPRVLYVGDDVAGCIQAVRDFPVMIKPVDGSASIGVFHCESEAQLSECFPLALEASTEGKVIVEEFLEGCEFTAHYTIVGGEPTLASIDNRYPVAVHSGNVTTIPAARVYPSLFLEEFLLQVNPFLKHMIANLGLRFGVVFVQGIYSPTSNKFGVFEGGLRGAGERPYRLISEVNGCDYSSMVLDFMVLGEEDLRWTDDARMGGKTCAVVSLVGKHGTVAKVEGVEEMATMFPQIVEHEIRYPVGSTIPDTDTLRQLAVRFFIVCKDRKELSTIIYELNQRVKVFDNEGNSLIVSLDPKRVIGLE